MIVALHLCVACCVVLSRPSQVFGVLCIPGFLCRCCHDFVRGVNCHYWELTRGCICAVHTHGNVLQHEDYLLRSKRVSKMQNANVATLAVANSNAHHNWPQSVFMSLARVALTPTSSCNVPARQLPVNATANGQREWGT